MIVGQTRTAIEHCQNADVQIAATTRMDRIKRTHVSVIATLASNRLIADPKKGPTMSLTEDEKALLLRACAASESAAKDSKLAAASAGAAVEQGQSLGLRFGTLEGRVTDHDRQLHDLNELILAGVHHVGQEESVPSHLSPPPSPMNVVVVEQQHRPQMKSVTSEVRESVRATAAASQVAATASQNSEEASLKVLAVNERQDSKLNQINANQRNLVAAFIGAVLMGMINQCNPATLQSWMHLPSSPHSAPSNPPPAPSR